MCREKASLTALCCWQWCRAPLDGVWQECGSTALRTTLNMVLSVLADPSSLCPVSGEPTQRPWARRPWPSTSGRRCRCRSTSWASAAGRRCWATPCTSCTRMERPSSPTSACSRGTALPSGLKAACVFVLCWGQGVSSQLGWDSVRDAGLTATSSVSVVLLIDWNPKTVCCPFSPKHYRCSFHCSECTVHYLPAAI